MRRRFAVLGVKRADNGYTVNLEAVDLVLVADYRLPEMTDEQVAELFSCVQSRGSIDAAVDIRTIEGARVSARLLQFKIAK